MCLPPDITFAPFFQETKNLKFARVQKHSKPCKSRLSATFLTKLLRLFSFHAITLYKPDPLVESKSSHLIVFSFFSIVSLIFIIYSMRYEPISLYEEISLVGSANHSYIPLAKVRVFLENNLTDNLTSITVTGYSLIASSRRNEYFSSPVSLSKDVFVST